MTDIGVHATHCCPEHGCKYCDDDCPVVNGKIAGIVCESCMLEEEDLKRLLSYKNTHEEVAVKHLGDIIGYGRMMQLAEQEWRKALKEQGWPEGGEFVSGPCKSQTVPCGCGTGCDWCEGSRWLTKKVKALKDEQDDARLTKIEEI